MKVNTYTAFYLAQVILVVFSTDLQTEPLYDDASTNSSIRVTWTAPAVPVISYKLSITELSGSDEPNMSKIVRAGSNLTVEFGSLQACTRYNICLFADGWSHPNCVEARTKPLPPFNFMNTAASPTSITVQWMEPNQTCKTYLLTYGIRDGSYTNTTEVTGSSYVINGLQPASLYRVVIKTKGLGLESHIRNRDIATYPSTLSGLNLTMNDVGNVSVQWTSPDEGVMFNYEFKNENGTIDSNKVTTTACSTELDSDKVNPTACSTEPRVPGANYTFCVNAVAHGYSSGEKCLNFTLKPKPVQQLTAVALNSVEASLTWRTDEESMQQSFDIGYMDYFNDTITVHGINVSAWHYHLLELYPGKNYTFRVNASSYGVKSEERSASCVLHPLAPLLECNNGTDNIELIITKGPSLVDEYDIRCSMPPCPGLVTVSSSGDNVTETFTGLTPLMNYTFEVIAKRLSEVSLPAVKVCITEEGAPGRVKNFKGNVITPVSVWIAWTQPTVKNGVLHFYTLTYSGRKTGLTNTTTITMNITDTLPVMYNETISDLIAGYTYEFTITATTVATGPGVSVTVTTPTLPITLSSPLLAAIIVPAVLAVLAIVTNIVCVIYHRRRNQRKDQQQTHTDDFDEELSETVGVYEPIDDTTEPENMTT